MFSWQRSMQPSLFYCGVRILPGLQSWCILALCITSPMAQEPDAIFPCFQHLEDGADDLSLLHLWAFLIVSSGKHVHSMAVFVA